MGIDEVKVYLSIVIDFQYLLIAYHRSVSIDINSN